MNGKRENRCETCFFWERLESHLSKTQDIITAFANGGACHRLPRAMSDQTPEGYWCGEHKPKDKQSSDRLAGASR